MWRGSLGHFMGDSIGFIINYVSESWRTSEQARQEVEHRKKVIQDWIDYQPKDSREMHSRPTRI